MPKKMYKWRVSIPEQVIEVNALYSYTAKDRALRMADGVKVQKIEEPK